MIPNTGENQLLNDLNIIEMLWNEMKRSIHTRHPQNVAELKQFCKVPTVQLPYACSSLLLPKKFQLSKVAVKLLNPEVHLLFYLDTSKVGSWFVPAVKMKIKHCLCYRNMYINTRPKELFLVL